MVLTIGPSRGARMGASLGEGLAKGILGEIEEQKKERKDKKKLQEYLAGLEEAAAGLPADSPLQQQLKMFRAIRDPEAQKLLSSAMQQHLNLLKLQQDQQQFMEKEQRYAGTRSLLQEYIRRKLSPQPVMGEEMIEEGVMTPFGGVEEGEVIEGEGAPRNLQQMIEVSPQQVMGGFPSPQQQGREDEELELLMALENPQLASLMQAQRLHQEKQREKFQEKTLDRHWEIAKPAMERVAKKEASLDDLQTALDAQVRAVKEGNLGAWTKDHIANMFGLEGLRSPEAAIFLSAAKTMLIDTLSGVSAKGLNQFLEKTMYGALMQLGRDEESNLAVAALFQTKLNKDKEYARIFNKLVEQDMRRYGTVLMDVEQRARKLFTPFAEKENKRLENEVRELENVYRRFAKKRGKKYKPLSHVGQEAIDDIKKRHKPKTKEGKKVKPDSPKLIMFKDGSGETFPVSENEVNEFLREMKENDIKVERVGDDN